MQPYIFRDKKSSLQMVKDLLGDEEYKYSSCSHESLAILYELASDPNYKNLPISPASHFVFGDIRGGATAMMTKNSEGIVISLHEADDFNGTDFNIAMNLCKKNDLAGHVIHVVADIDDFEDHIRAPGRLCFIDGDRDIDNLTIMIQWEIEIGLEAIDNSGYYEKGWLMLTPYGEKDHAVTQTVDALLETHADWFDSIKIVDKLICLGYAGGYEHFECPWNKKRASKGG